MKTCKKCGKPLPDSYRSKLCEHCMGKRAEALKNAGKAALSIAVMVGGTVVAMATKGKISPAKK